MKSPARMAVLVAVLAAGVAYVFYTRLAGAPPGQMGGGQPPVPVEVVTVQPQDMPRSLEGLGQLEARRQVLVAAEAEGRVTKIAFESGRRVKAGTLLVQQDDRSESADLRYYRARLKLAKRELDRLLSLEGVGATKSRIDEQRSLVEETLSQIARTETLLDHKRIEAPFDGVLGIRQVDYGAYLEAGDPVVTLTDIGGFFVNFALPENALPALHEGQAAKVHIDAFPERSFDAEITSVEPQIDGDLHTVYAQATLTRAPEQLRPGLFARVELLLPPLSDVILVPETALSISAYGDSVFVVRDTPEQGQRAQSVAVKPGPRSDGSVAIRSGLKAGDRVVIAGQNRLYPGAAVTIQEDGSAPRPATGDGS